MLSVSMSAIEGSRAFVEYEEAGGDRSIIYGRVTGVNLERDALEIRFERGSTVLRMFSLPDGNLWGTDDCVHTLYVDASDFRRLECHPDAAGRLQHMRELGLHFLEESYLFVEQQLEEWLQKRNMTVTECRKTIL